MLQTRISRARFHWSLQYSCTYMFCFMLNVSQNSVLITLPQNIQFWNNLNSKCIDDSATHPSVAEAVTRLYLIPAERTNYTTALWATAARPDVVPLPLCHLPFRYAEPLYGSLGHSLTTRRMGIISMPLCINIPTHMCLRLIGWGVQPVSLSLSLLPQIWRHLCPQN